MNIGKRQKFALRVIVTLALVWFVGLVVGSILSPAHAQEPQHRTIQITAHPSIWPTLDSLSAQANVDRLERAACLLGTMRLSEDSTNLTDTLYVVTVIEARYLNRELDEVAFGCPQLITVGTWHAHVPYRNGTDTLMTDPDTLHAEATPSMLDSMSSRRWAQHWDVHLHLISSAPHVVRAYWQPPLGNLSELVPPSDRKP